MKRHKNSHNKRPKKKVKKEKDNSEEIKESILDEKKKLEAERREELQKLSKFLKTEEDEGENEAEDDELEGIDYDDEDEGREEYDININEEKKPVITGTLPTHKEKTKNTYKPLNCDVLSKESKDEVRDRILPMFKTVPPRSHQLDAVTCLIHDISKKITSNSSFVDYIDSKTRSDFKVVKSDDGEREMKIENSENKEHINYLIQHAAGSGKSLTISCLACALARLERTVKEKQPSSSSSKPKRVPLFEKIIIVNDRKHLDSQLGECVCAMLEANNIHNYVRVKRVVELEKALLSDKKIIITTLQKFRFNDAASPSDIETTSLLEQIPIAIISDEAHRSHGAKTTRKLHAILTGDTQQAPNIVYFAFTSTPSPRSLEMFGNPSCDENGRKKASSDIRPFHTFTFPEALSAGYILDFTANYAFVTSDILIEEVGEQSLEVVSDGHRAAAALIAQADEYAPFLASKAQFIVKHLVTAIAELDKPDVGFRALAMLVVRSRRHIVWYTKYLRGLVAALPEEQRFGIIAAFSPFIYEGSNLTEASPAINEGYSRFYNSKFGIVQAIREKEGADIRLIVVADKLQTGFDEPRLSVLYVDKPLRGSNVVQTLGRVSRAAPGKSEVFVVDFANKKDDIASAVSMYWDVSVLGGVPSKQLIQKKLASLAAELGTLDGVYDDDPQRALVTLVAEDIRRKKLGGKDRFSSMMTLFLRLCDRLQVDEEAGVKYSTIQRLKGAFFEVKTLDRSSEIKSLTDSVQVKFEFNKGSSVKPEKLDITPTNDVFKYNISGTRSKNEKQMTVGEVIELANISLQSRVMSNGFRPSSPMSEEAMDVLFDTPACEVLPQKDDSKSSVPVKKADTIITNDVETILKFMNPKSAESTKKRGIEMLLRGLKTPALCDAVTRKFAAEDKGTQLLLSIIGSEQQFTASSVYILIGALKSLTYLALSTSCVARQVRTSAGNSNIFAALKKVLTSKQALSMPVALQRTLYSTTAQALTVLCEKNPGNCKAVLDSEFLDILCCVLSSALNDCRATASFEEYEVVMISILRFFGFFCSFGGSVPALRTLPLADVLVSLIGENRSKLSQILCTETEKVITELAKVSEDISEAIKKKAKELGSLKTILKFIGNDTNGKANAFSPYSVASPQKKKSK